MFIPLVIVLTVNLFMDYRGYYSETFSQKILKSLTSNDVSINSEPSLRKIKKGLVLQNQNKHFNKIILGSSRTMHFGNRDSTLLNLSVPGAVLEDYIILLDYLDSSNIKYDTIVISAHPWMFNKNHGDIRYMTFNKSFFIDSIKYAFSWQYFLDNLSFDKYKEWDGNEDDFVIFRNGTVRFNKLFKQQKTKVSDYVTNALQSSFKDFNIIDENYKNEFQVILKELTNEHVVELVLLPYHPQIYSELITKLPIVLEIEEFYYSLDDDHISVHGTYDPTIQNFSEKDFYDANHMTQESLMNLYNSRYSYKNIQ